MERAARPWPRVRVHERIHPLLVRQGLYQGQGGVLKVESRTSAVLKARNGGQGEILVPPYTRASISFSLSLALS
jgi:hypothetical protein